MAIVVNEPRVGQRVYKHARPQVAGVIKKVLGLRDHATTWRVRVKWLNGSEEELDSWNLKDFDALIADHEKKLQTHLATKKKLEAL
jgi:hypothetical protein